MLSYPIDDAETLLDTKLKTAQTTLSNCEEDLDFLREQITVRISEIPRKLSCRRPFVTSANTMADDGGGGSAGVQLGGGSKEKGQNRG